MFFYKKKMTKFKKKIKKILGLLFLRDLVMVDPDDRIEVSTVTNYYKHQLKDIDENTKLDDMLEIFKVSTIIFNRIG